MRNRRGFMLILALFLLIAVVLTAMAFVGTRGLRYQEATRAVSHRKALALARAGIEDARVKLEKDSAFPPPGGLEQKIFTYQEEVTDLAKPDKVGSYMVAVDTTWCKDPYGVIVITSTGSTGDPDFPEATAVVRAELDVKPVNRVTGAAPNPNLYKFIRWTEEGDL